jgi:hypothetical protein
LVSIRPEVQPVAGLPPVWIALSTRWPLPSWKTLAVLLVIVSISPVPNVLPAPVSYFQFESMPVPEAPLKSSLQVVVKPAGGAGTVSGDTAAACAAAGRTAAALPPAPVTARAISPSAPAASPASPRCTRGRRVPGIAW